MGWERAQYGNENNKPTQRLKNFHNLGHAQLRMMFLDILFCDNF